MADSARPNDHADLEPETTRLPWGGKPDTPLHILSLDGGGFRGMFSAAVLAAVEEDLQISVADSFDLIVGTSTGGLIAIGLGAGLTPAQILDFYAERGPQIFGGHPARAARRALRPKYRSAPLRTALTAIVGARRLADSRVRLVVPAYNIGRDEVYVFKTPHHVRLKRDWRELMVDVAMATTAAPTYFPAFSLNHVRLIDGGVWANNPVLVGIAEATSLLYADMGAIRVFSLGSTNDLVRRRPSLDRGGLAQWAMSATDVVLRGQSVGANNLAVHLLGEDHILRLDPVVPAGVLAIDRVVPSELVGLARAESRQAMPRIERMFGHHRAIPFKAFHGLTAEGEPVHA